MERGRQTKLYESAYLTIEHRDGVCLVDVKTTPPTNDLEEIAATVEAHFRRDACVLHVRLGPHTTVPTLSHITHVLSLLNRHADLIHTSLVGTVVQCPGLMRTVCDFVLTLYQPKKPLLLTCDPEEAEAFLSVHA